MSPTIKRAVLSGTARKSACISMTSTIEVSSTTSRSQSSGLSSPRLKPPPLGSTSSNRWMVLASKPVASVRRLAARPVGAHSNSSVPFAARMRRIALTMVVLPTPGPPVMTKLGCQREPDRGDLAFGQGNTDTLFDPRQGLVRIDPGPWQRAICYSRQPLGDGAFRPMQTSKKDAGRFTNPVSDHRALLQLEVERSPDQLLRHLEQLLGQRHQLVGRQTAMAFVHRFGQRVGNARTHPDHRRLFDAQLHRKGVGGLEADAADVAREPVRVLG